MIAGIAHLTMEATLAQGVELGSHFGFQEEFHNDVVLPAAFEGVEDTDHPLPLALLGGPQGMRLEIVQHRWQARQQSAYTAIFRGAPLAAPGEVLSRPSIRDALVAAAVLRDPVCVRMKVPEGEAWFDAAGSDSGLAGIVCRARDLGAEAHFWEAFARAKWTTINSDVACGTVSAPLKQAGSWLVLVPGDPESGAYNMNDQGFPSIGVASTALEPDCEKALAAGAKLRAAPIITTVGGRQLKMALIETPGGALVELLSLHRKAQG